MMVLAALLFLGRAAGVPPATADALISRHVAASGGEDALRAIVSLTFESVDEKGVVTPVFLKMRPDYSLVGCTRDDCGYAEGFDGHRAWELQPRRGRLYTARGEAARAIRRAGRFDFPFIDYRKKGNVVRLEGTEKLDGVDTFRLAVKLADGLDETFLFDARTLLVVANRRRVPMHARGPRYDTITRFSDYRKVAGYSYPFHLETRDEKTGEVLEDGQWAAIVPNAISNTAIFEPPVPSPTPATRLFLSLYDDAPRMTGAAILGAYLDFHRQHPAVDTSSDLTWLGYQLLKDERDRDAVSIFRQLTSEHPDSSDAWDSLGDGCEQGGDFPAAILAFQKAVELDPKAADSAKKLARLRSPLPKG